MSQDSRKSRGTQPPDTPQRYFTRLMYGGAGIALVGVVLATTLAYVHAQIDQHAGAYTSFCNVNESINCDRVLTSPFATVAGVAVAWWALLAYAALAAAFFAAARSSDARRHQAVRLAALGSIGSAVFSVYMAAVSLFVLETICLMCSGMYVVAAGLLGVLASARAAYRAIGGRPETVLPGGPAGSLTLTSIAVAAFAVFAWPAGDSIALPASASLETLRAADQEFYAWYTNLPVVKPAAGTLAGDGGTKGAAGKKVTIVEFSDFECGHCRQNHHMLRQLESRLGSLVNIVYRHFPLDTACNDALQKSIHQRACRAAAAAECAAAQNRFADMSDALFENQSRLFDEMLTKLAHRLELDTEAFAQCMAGGESMNKVIADAQAGKRLNLTSTPTLFINGRRVTGTFDSANAFDRAVLIEARLAEGRTLN